MSNKKNIDRLFQEKFKDFEVAPEPKVWKNIEQKLQGKKKKKVLIPLWYKLGGVAALITIIFLVGNSILKPNDNHVVNTEQQPIEKNQSSKSTPKTFTDKSKITENEEAIATSTAQDENTLNEEKNTLQTTNKKSTSTENTIATTHKNAANNLNAKESNQNIYESETPSGVVPNSKTTENKNELTQENNSSRLAQAKHSTKNKKSKETGISTLNENQSLSDEKNISSQKERIADGTSIKKDEKEQLVSVSEKTTTPSIKNTEALEDSITKPKESLVEVAQQLKKEDKNVEEIDSEEKNLSKWLINPTVSPIYYSSLSGKGSTIDPKLSQNDAEGEVTMAYGVNFAYAVSEKIKIRSGISKVNMNYNTNDILFGSSIEAVKLASIDKNVNTETLDVTNFSHKNNTASEVSTNAISNYSQGNIKQELGFIEVPLEIEYALLNKRFGINIIGGASTLFLNKNNVAIQSEMGNTNLGKANNINNISFTTNIGLGFDYGLTSKIDFSLEPTFKYQLNTYNDNLNGFQPYYFGVYTGFSFKF